jgi:hypothetical protein
LQLDFLKKFPDAPPAHREGARAHRQTYAHREGARAQGPVPRLGAL